jgi:murein L,D-transpeptidase YcbB/YkuD
LLCEFLLNDDPLETCAKEYRMFNQSNPANLANLVKRIDRATKCVNISSLDLKTASLTAFNRFTILIVIATFNAPLPAMAQITSVGADSSASVRIADVQSIRSSLVASSSKTPVSAALTRFYTDFGFQPVFTQGAQLTSHAAELRQAIATLPLNDYWNPQLESYFAQTPAANDMVRVELDLARAYVSAAVHLNIGRVIPTQVATDIKYPTKSFERFDLLKAGITNNGIRPTLDALAPQMDAYQRLRYSLSRLRSLQAQGGFAAIAKPGKSLKIGVNDPAVSALKQRLIAYGYNINSTSSVYDAELAAAVKDMQAANLEIGNGVVSASDHLTMDLLRTSSAIQILQVELAMEKYRWLPAELGARHIFINLATQTFQLVDANNSNPKLMEMRTINGKPTKRTPSLVDRINYIILNPNWNVPGDHIFATEKLPEIKDLAVKEMTAPGTLQGWFDRNRFKLMGKDFRTEISPASVEWSTLEPALINFYMVQKPGYTNSLGVVKFGLTNGFDIYMHDTDERYLFPQPNRLKSHGCIRLQNPIDLAVYLLQGTKWDEFMIQQTVAKPGESIETETPVVVPKENKIPVYTMYATVNTGPDKILRFTKDYYGETNALYRALRKSGYYRP